MSMRGVCDATASTQRHNRDREKADEETKRRRHGRRAGRPRCGTRSEDAEHAQEEMKVRAQVAKASGAEENIAHFN